MATDDTQPTTSGLPLQGGRGPNCGSDQFKSKSQKAQFPEHLCNLMQTRTIVVLLLWLMMLKLLSMTIPFAADQSLLGVTKPIFERLKPDIRNLLKAFGSIWFWTLLFLVQSRLEAGSKQKGVLRYLLILAPCTGGTAAEVGKLIFGRLRPFSENGYIFREHFNLLTTNLGYPSSHAATAWAGAFSIALLYPRLRWIVVAMATGCSLQRIASYQHYPSDVMGGFLTGWAAVVLLVSIGGRKQILTPDSQSLN